MTSLVVCTWPIYSSALVPPTQIMIWWYTVSAFMWAILFTCRYVNHCAILLWAITTFCIRILCSYQSFETFFESCIHLISRELRIMWQFLRIFFHACLFSDNLQFNKMKARKIKVCKDRLFSVAVHPSSTKVIAVAGDKWGQMGFWDVVSYCIIIFKHASSHS